MGLGTAHRVRQRPRMHLKAGPFRGMRYSRWDGHADPSLAFLAYNAYVDVAGDGSAYRSRPGRLRVSSSAIGGGGNGQLVYQFTKNDGTQYTVAICGGKFYTLAWNSETWTEVLTASDFSGASITLSSTARCSAVTFNNTLVVSDGVNVPWTWDGTTNGGLTKLTNAPVAYGQPTVYAAKLFFIKNTDRASIVWSEESAANTGYEAGGYSNVWALIQTGSEPLQAIRGTNDGLYFWRQRSIGVVRGAFNADFQTSNTFDGVSTRIGTRSPRGVLYYNNTFYFPDEYGRPWAMQPGGNPEPLWEQVALAFPQDTTDDNAIQAVGWNVAVSATDLTAMETVPVSSIGCVLFTSSPSTSSGDDTHGGILFRLDGRAQGLWEWNNTTAGVGASGEVLNSDTALPEVLQVEDDGRTYAFGRRDIWYDEESDGDDASTASKWVGPKLGANDRVDLQFIQADVVTDARTGGAGTSVQVDVLTSRNPTIGSVQAATATTSLTNAEIRVPFGVNAAGRWGMLYVIVSTTDNLPATLHGYTLTAIPMADYPTVP